MLDMVAAERRRARTIPVRSPLTRVTPALSIATSVPVQAEVLPEDKRKVVERLRREGRAVAMAGDGVNYANLLHDAQVANDDTVALDGVSDPIKGTTPRAIAAL